MVRETECSSDIWNLHKNLPLPPSSLPILCNYTSKSFLFGTCYVPQMALRASAAPLMRRNN